MADDDFLSGDEEIVLDLKPHWWVFALPSTIVVVAFVVWVALDVTAIDWVAIIALLVGAGWLGLKYVGWSQTRFIVTTRRVIYRSGVVRKSGIEIPLSRINNVIFSQRLFERALGAGDLLIESAGESGQSRFYNVRKPSAVQNEINNQRAALEDRRYEPRSGPAPSPQSLGDELSKIEALREQGVLSDEEFDAAKRRLLGQ